MGDVVALVRVEVDGEGFPCLPGWAAERVGLGVDQRRLVVLGDGRIELAHLVPEVAAVKVGGPEAPETTPAA